MLSGKMRVVGLFAIVMFLAAGGIYAWDATAPGVTAADSTDSNTKALAVDHLKPVGHYLSAFTFAEQVTTETNPELELFITSARHGKPVQVTKGTMQLFFPGEDLANTGGVCWTCGDREGAVQFNHTPWTVVVIRCTDGKVHWYRMEMKAYGC